MLSATAAARRLSALHVRHELGRRLASTLGIRRENKGRWERRVPLTPDHVRLLVDQGVDVLVQPSKLRVFGDQEYARMGATITDDLSRASTILGVKEIPVEELLEDKTYFFFSHTFKAQEYNMPMLDAILQKRIRLVDYERMVNDRGERIVKFGRFAGVAGMMNLLHGLGNRLLGMGYHTPFLYVGLARNYPDLGQLRGAVRSLGNEIAKNGVPEPMNPFMVVFTGNGAVSQGAQEVFNELPHRYISVEEMEFLVQSGTASRNLAYGVVVEPPDYLKHKRFTTGRFSRDHYYQHPEEYISTFHYKVAPYASAIVNCMYWESRYPRIMTVNDIRDLTASNRTRLLGIADISADPSGSIEFMRNCTTMDDPFELYDPKTDSTHRNMHGDGILMMSVDNLPAELPSEASAFFGTQLLPYVQYYLTDPKLEQHNVMARCLQRAMETADGELAPGYSYISELRRENAKQRKHVLLLGSGMVAGPVVDNLLEDPNVRITLATLHQSEGERLVRGHDHVEVVPFDVSRATPDRLKQLVGDHNVVISLVPAAYHQRVAEACVEANTHLVTASYTSPEMASLHERAKAANVTILNEIGLDPGIDHLSAMKVINEVRQRKGKITSFISWCGGLPAPECSDNPLGYKFSWSPKGVLLAGLNSARFRYEGKLVEVPGKALFNNVDIVPVVGEFKGYNLEGLPNRDSLPYSKAYGITDASTMFRGTLRYKGFSKVMRALNDVGLFSTSPSDELQKATDMTWRELMTRLVPNANEGTIEAALYSSLQFDDESDRDAAFKALIGLGLLSEDKIDPCGTYIDTLCARLQKELAFKAGERDMVLLHHVFGVEYPTGAKETRTSSLIEYGAGYGKGDSAMSRTVGIPVAIAARLIVDGQIQQRGCIVPLTQDIYDPMLHMLAERGIECVEKVLPDWDFRTAGEHQMAA